MNYNYSRSNIKVKEKLLARILEIVPGALSWLIILGMLILSIARPIAAAVIMIAFILYWVLRLIYMNIFLILSYARLAIEKETDWMERIWAVGRLESYIKEECNKKHKSFRNKVSSMIHCSELLNLLKSGAPTPNPNNIYHLVIIPVVKETREVIEPGIKAIKSGRYPCARTLIILALEERAAQEVQKDVQEIKGGYAGEFLDVVVVRHPETIEGEARVKGANASYAAKYAKEYFDKEKIPYENVIVSCFDADTVPAPDYFSCLTYNFIISPDRVKRSYQPVPVYHNNIWEVPSFARIIDIGTSFFELIEATNPRKMVTFSSHSMSFKALDDVGFWPVDMISDDSAIFWKAFIHYDGDYQTAPIYTTVSMDIVTGKNWIQTFVNIYKQKLRWAWGVENFPIVIRAFLKSKSISLYKKITYGFKLLEAFVSWSSWSFLLTMSWLTGFIAGKEFSNSTVYYIAPRIQTTIFGLASFGLVICMCLSILMLPASKHRRNLLMKAQHIFEWLFIPVIILLLSALPAIDAQTRLMLGKYMEFRVTEKYRKK